MTEVALWTAVAALATAVTTVVLAGQWRLARRESRHDEATLLHLLATRWRELDRSFRISIMIALGPDDAYVEATSQERDRYRRLLKLLELRLAGVHAERERVARDLAMDFELLEKRLGRLSHEDEATSLLAQGIASLDFFNEDFADELHDLGLEHSRSVRDVLLHMSFASTLILRGHITPRAAYEIMGPLLVRRSRPIRDLLAWDGEWLSFRPGIADRVRYLLDAVWAEAARSNELASGEVADAAAIKRWSRSGVEARRRTHRLVQGAGTWRRSWTLRRQLAWAEVMPRASRSFVVMSRRTPVYCLWLLKGFYRHVRRWLSTVSPRWAYRIGAIQSAPGGAYGTSLIVWITDLVDQGPTHNVALSARITDSAQQTVEIELLELRSTADVFEQGPVYGVALPLERLMVDGLRPGRASARLSLSLDGDQIQTKRLRIRITNDLAA